MKLLSVSGHGCIRATKMNLALIEKGHEVHFATRKTVPYGINYKSHVLGEDLNQMREAFRIYEPHVDFCHAHNEPSWYVTLWKEISDKPVILDVHDSCLARVSPEDAQKQIESGKGRNIRISCEERNNFQLADALVFPGKRFGDLVCSEFGLNQPRLDLPSYVPRHFYSYFPLEWQGGLVYEGKVALENELPMFKYCDYRDLAVAAGKTGMDFHIYCPGYADKVQKLYTEKDCPSTYVHIPVLMEDLTKKIGRHDWGLVGNVFQTSEWDAAMPNKLFEYLAAGLPVVVMNASDCADFVLEHGVGIVVGSIEELATRWSEHRICREQVAKKRMKFCMEERIGQLELFYEEVLCRNQWQSRNTGKMCQEQHRAVPVLS